MLDSLFRMELPLAFSTMRACDTTSCETARLCALSSSAWSRGELTEALRLADEACRGHAACGGSCAGPATVWHAALLVRVRECISGARTLARIEELTVGAEDAQGLVAASLICAGDLALAQGDVGAAADAVGRGIHLAQRAGLHCLLPDAHTVMALSALRQGNMSMSLEFVDQLRDDALLGRTSDRPSQYALAAAQLLEVQGGAKSAAHFIVGIITDDQLILELLASQPAAAAWLVRATRELGDASLAARVASEASGLAARNPGLRSLEAAAAHAGGLLGDDAERLVAAGAAHVDPWAGASAYEDAGKLLAAPGRDRDRAVEILERAVDGYTNAGAPRDARRVVSKLRALGVRRGRYPRYAGQDGANTGSLTETEAAVAELVSHGFTNSQVGEHLFISGHTVAFHLKKIFRKLNVASRVELTRAWSRLSDTAGEPASLG
ncbi:LuxR C-terminal-related transcriptional regulator [Streptomyces sp. NPDC048349]|uniref:LuxR C-terminal-related transcriptional regulator n=1 Tax=Streptomyces sp. NPDC048349 TaxID=3155486 RepID=UPI00343269F9